MSKTISSKFKSENDTGFGSTVNSQGDRLINKDGSVNVIRRGQPFLERFHFFHTLITMSWSHFSLIVVLFYVVMNIIFGFIYYSIGIEHLNGTLSESKVDALLESFFFSTQTFATVGYGRINPTGILTNIVASLEALLGVLSLALVTSLLYSRFSRPKIKLVYSKNMLIAPYKGKSALMFRLANSENELLIECTIEVIVSLLVTENGKTIRKFLNLALERHRVISLASNWTIVHPLDEDSPIFGYTASDLTNSEAEFMVQLKAFHNTYSQSVFTRTSYKFDEIVWGAKFKPMFHRSDDGQSTILHMDLISDYEIVKLD